MKTPGQSRVAMTAATVLPIALVLVLILMIASAAAFHLADGPIVDMRL